MSTSKQEEMSSSSSSPPPPPPPPPPYHLSQPSSSADDTASLFSTTDTLVDLSILPGYPSIDSPLSPEQLHCSLFASYNIHSPLDAPFRAAGFYAGFSRGESAASSSSRLSQSITKLHKRLSVQLPLSRVAEPYSVLPSPSTGAELAARTSDVKAGRRLSLFHTQLNQLTGVIRRPILTKLLEGMYFVPNVSDHMAIFPKHSVLSYGASFDSAGNTSSNSGGSGKLGWLKSLTNTKPSSNNNVEPIRQSSQDNLQPIESVKVSMTLATLDILSPPADLLATQGPFPRGLNQPIDNAINQSLKLLSEWDRMSNQDRFQSHFWQQDESTFQLMLQVLFALERRGSIWSEAGQMTTPQSRNLNPRLRPRFFS